jgi:hypothetical protein
VYTSDTSNVFFRPKRDKMDDVVAVVEGPEKGVLFLFFEFESSEDEEGMLEEALLSSFLFFRIVHYL